MKIKMLKIHNFQKKIKIIKEIYQIKNNKIQQKDNKNNLF